MPAPVQAAMVAALDDDAHADEQRERYRSRRTVLRAALEAAGWVIENSEAGLYLWAVAGWVGRMGFGPDTGRGRDPGLAG